LSVLGSAKFKASNKMVNMIQNSLNSLTANEGLLTDQIFKVVDDVFCSYVENEAVLLHVASGMYYSLSETSLPFWEALQKQQPFGPVVETITEEYSVDRDQVLSDLQVFLQELSSYGLICKVSD
jgi:Coenzyme PQQ synthesis protein D (PqqD)